MLLKVIVRNNKDYTQTAKYMLDKGLAQNVNETDKVGEVTGDFVEVSEIIGLPSPSFMDVCKELKEVSGGIVLVMIG